MLLGSSRLLLSLFSCSFLLDGKTFRRRQRHYEPLCAPVGTTASITLQIVGKLIGLGIENVVNNFYCIFLCLNVAEISMIDIVMFFSIFYETALTTFQNEIKLLKIRY